MVVRREQRLQRKLEKITQNSFPGLPGKTLSDQMRDALDAELLARGKITDAQERIKNEGRIQGMLKMLAILRQPSSAKNELELAKARIANKE